MSNPAMTHFLDEFDPLADKPSTTTQQQTPVQQSQPQHRLHQQQQNNASNSTAYNFNGLSTALVAQQQQQQLAPAHTRQRSRANTNPHLQLNGTLDKASRKLKQTQRQNNNSNSHNNAAHGKKRVESDEEDDDSDDESSDEEDDDETDSDVDDKRHRNSANHTSSNNIKAKAKPTASTPQSTDRRNPSPNKSSTSSTTTTRTTTTGTPFTTYAADDKCSVAGCIQKRLPQSHRCPIHSTRGLQPVVGKNPDEWFHDVTHTNTSMGMNKNCILWRFVDKGEKYEVELFHSTFSGKRTVRINGVDKVSEKKSMDNGSRYNFQLGRDRRTNLSIEIRPAGLLGHNYEAFINGRPYIEAKKYWVYNASS